MNQGIPRSMLLFKGVLLLFSHQVMSDSLWPHGLQHFRHPCPSPSPRVCTSSFYCTSDAIQPSHPLLPSSPSAFNLSQHQGIFQWTSCSPSKGKQKQKHSQQGSEVQGNRLERLQPGKGVHGGEQMDEAVSQRNTCEGHSSRTRLIKTVKFNWRIIECPRHTTTPTGLQWNSGLHLLVLQEADFLWRGILREAQCPEENQNKEVWWIWIF